VDLFIDIFPVFFNKVIYQQGNVVHPFSQRRQDDVDDLEPKIEILPKTAFLHLLFEINIGGCDDPGVDKNRGITADRIKGTFL